MESIVMEWSKYNNLSILIIDDDQFTRELIETILKKIPNINIYQASDGVEALTVINEVPLDMVFLDLYMPNMNGQEFMDNLRASDKSKSFPIVLITTDRLTRSELSDIGADHYLTKPFDFNSFLEKTYSFLDNFK
jgi:putative two-component system response regulator